MRVITTEVWQLLVCKCINFSCNWNLFVSYFSAWAVRLEPVSERCFVFRCGRQPPLLLRPRLPRTALRVQVERLLPTAIPKVSHNLNFWVIWNNLFHFRHLTSLENSTLAPSAGRKLKGKFFQTHGFWTFWALLNFLSIQPLSRCFNGGRCSDGVDSFSCVCEDGFSGEYCECTDAPEEGGDVTCLNVTALYSHTLPPNFDDILLATTTTTQVKLKGQAI